MPGVSVVASDAPRSQHQHQQQHQWQQWHSVDMCDADEFRDSSAPYEKMFSAVPLSPEPPEIFYASQASVSSLSPEYHRGSHSHDSDNNNIHRSEYGYIHVQSPLMTYQYDSQGYDDGYGDGDEYGTYMHAGDEGYDNDGSVVGGAYAHALQTPPPLPQIDRARTAVRDARFDAAMGAVAAPSHQHIRQPNPIPDLSQWHAQPIYSHQHAHAHHVQP